MASQKRKKKTGEFAEGEEFSPYRRFYIAPVPRSLLADQRLSQGAKLLWGVLAMHHGEEAKYNIGITQLAAELGVSTDSVGRWMKELVIFPLIKRTRRSGLPWRYVFVWHRVLEESLQNGR